MSLYLHVRDKLFRVRDQAALPVPLDPDLLFLAEQAKSQSVVQDIYRMQMERNKYRPFYGDTDFVESDHPRNKSGEFTKGAGRARRGGEVAVSNKAFYKGGQFLPSTEAPPGTYKIKG